MAEHFDLRRFRAGQLYRLDRFLDGRVREFEYEIDADRRLIARRAHDGCRAASRPRSRRFPKQRARRHVDGQISRETPSLIEALEAAERMAASCMIELALALADIFSGEVDFNSDLQPGERFRLWSSARRARMAQFGGYGPILAAESEDRRAAARRALHVPGGKAGYYDEQGRSLKRFLLKSPLKFDPRITSGFSRSRRHPILNYTRAHNGVDYAAPPGAPVAAVAGGIVTLAGWSGGGGRTVKLRHASGYESEYLHLSAIAPGFARAAGSARVSSSDGWAPPGSRPVRICTTACDATACTSIRCANISTCHQASRSRPCHLATSTANAIG